MGARHVYMAINVVAGFLGLEPTEPFGPDAYTDGRQQPIVEGARFGAADGAELLPTAGQIERIMRNLDKTDPTSAAARRC